MTQQRKLGTENPKKTNLETANGTPKASAIAVPAKAIETLSTRVAEGNYEVGRKTAGALREVAFGSFLAGLGQGLEDGEDPFESVDLEVGDDFFTVPDPASFVAAVGGSKSLSPSKNRPSLGGARPSLQPASGS